MSITLYPPSIEELPVPLDEGGTGADLTDPNADRILFWDDSTGEAAWLTAGTGLSISGTTMTATGSGGTVTSASVTTANGVSGSVATATTTPAITLTLGAITPTSVNGLTITASTGTLTVTNGKVLSVSNTLTFTGTDSSSVAFGTGGTVLFSGGALGTPASGVATNLTGTAAGLTAGNVTTNANLTGPITSTGNATAVAAQTGTGSTFVMQTAPSITSPQMSLTAAHGSDDTYTGTTIVGLNAGATIAQWEAVYLGASSTWLLADANGASTYPARGLAAAGYSSTNPAVILVNGTVRNDAWNWTPGGTIYLSGTPGALTQSIPAVSGDNIQQVGFALTADIAFFDFNSTFVTLA